MHTQTFFFRTLLNLFHKRNYHQQGEKKIVEVVGRKLEKLTAINKVRELTQANHGCCNSGLLGGWGEVIEKKVCRMLA